MSNCRVNVDPGGRIDLQVDQQHISRITHKEARELILHLLIFGGKKMRDEVYKWLHETKVEQIAEVIAPEPATPPGVQNV
jgi:hypothetical protein